MIYDTDEIVRSYKQAKRKTEQIFILADLNDSDPNTIIGILNEAGALDYKNLKIRICCRCDMEYIAASNRGLPICPDCRGTAEEIKFHEYELKSMTAKIQKKIREIGKLKAESAALREKIDAMKGDQKRRTI